MEQNRDILVSVITVCYNSSNTIARTIESVLNQSYNNIEYIIIDGASTDNTISIVDKYQPVFLNKFHRKIRIISEPDDGIYDAMNKGISLAQGAIIGILNSDDTYEVEAVSMVVQHMKKDAPLQVCYGGIKIYDSERLKSIIFYAHEFMEERMIAHPSCFVTKAVYEKYGTFNMRYKSAADYEFMLRIYNKKDILFERIYSPLANFYLGGMSTTYAGHQDKLKMLYETGRMKRNIYLCKLLYLRIVFWMKQIKMKM